MSNTLPECAVILAAGRGTRLGDMTRALPKCMVPVSGRTMLERAMEVLEQVGVRRVVIVTGHESDYLEEYAGRLQCNLDVECVHSSDYETTNNIVSLWRAAGAVDTSFLLIESDLLFTESLVQTLVESGSGAVVSPLAKWMDGTVVTVNESGLIEKVCLSNDAIPSRPVFKTTNIYRIDMPDWVNAIFPALDRRVQAGSVDVYYERAFADVVAEGRLAMRAVICDESQWREVDTPEDLKQAECWLASNRVGVNVD